MAFVQRLHLRENWPLWAALIALLLAILHIIIVASTPHYPFESSIVYPLLAVAPVTIIILACFAVVTFLSVEIWSVAVIPENKFVWLVFLGLIAGIVFCVGSPVLGFLLIVVTLFAIALVSSEYNRKRGLANFITLLSLVFVAVVIILRLFTGFQHVDGIRIGDNNFNLTLLTDAEVTDSCINRYFVVYKCPALAIICNSVYRSENYYQCSSLGGETPLPKDTHFVLDPADNALYVQIGDERTLIAR